MTVPAVPPPPADGPREATDARMLHSADVAPLEDALFAVLVSNAGASAWDVSRKLAHAVLNAEWRPVGVPVEPVDDERRAKAEHVVRDMANGGLRRADDEVMDALDVLMAEYDRRAQEIEQAIYERDEALVRVAAAEAVQSRMADSLPDHGPWQEWSERDRAVRDYEGDLSDALSVEVDPLADRRIEAERQRDVLSSLLRGMARRAVRTHRECMSWLKQAIRADGEAFEARARLAAVRALADELDPPMCPDHRGTNRAGNGCAPCDAWWMSSPAWGARGREIRAVLDGSAGSAGSPEAPLVSPKDPPNLPEPSEWELQMRGFLGNRVEVVLNEDPRKAIVGVLHGFDTDGQVRISDEDGSWGWAWPCLDIAVAGSSETPVESGDTATSSDSKSGERRPHAEAPTDTEQHRYLSTACLHLDHGYCQSAEGYDAAGDPFARRPSQCKFCAAPCVCSCHRAVVRQDDTETTRTTSPSDSESSERRPHDAEPEPGPGPHDDLYEAAGKLAQHLDAPSEYLAHSVVDLVLRMQSEGSDTTAPDPDRARLREVLDALGMAATRDWDDALNALRCLRTAEAEGGRRERELGAAWRSCRDDINSALDQLTAAGCPPIESDGVSITLRQYLARGDTPAPTLGDEDVRAIAQMVRDTTAPDPGARKACRGDAVEAWIKAARDRQNGDGTPWDRGRWNVLDDLLDDYRLHSDTGTPLDQHACDGGYCCADEPAAPTAPTPRIAADHLPPTLIGTYADPFFADHAENHKHPVDGCGFCPEDAP